MSIAQPPQLLTTQQLMEMPDDGKERWLIRGELREKELTRRNRGHSRIEGKIAHLLHKWLESQPEPHGEVLVGEAGIRLLRNPDTTVGVDVAYISPETADANPNEEGFVDGVPVLVAEILSPSDREEEINEKVEGYLDAGVKLVWVVDPAFRTITVYRPDAEPQLYNVTHTFEGDPHLPGFRVPVAEVFTR
jgi:Uma2 family endonuclease